MRTCFLNNLAVEAAASNCYPLLVEFQGYFPICAVGGSSHNQRIGPSSSHLQYEALPAAAHRGFHLTRSHWCQMNSHTCRRGPAIHSEHTRRISRDRELLLGHLWHLGCSL